MEVTAVILHGGALAEYEVEVRNDGLCTAQLAHYKGSPANTPPQRITLKKEGRHWVSDVSNRDLSDDIGYAVEIKAKPLLESRNRSGSHPAG